MSATVRNILAILILCLSLISVFGFFTNNSKLKKFGEAYGVALHPTPFTERSGYENYSSAIELTAVFKDGSTVKVDNNTFFSHLSGPHRHKSVYVNIFFWGPLFTTNWSYPLYEYAFCTGTFLEGDVDSVVLKYSNARTGKPLTTLTYVCK